MHRPDSKCPGNLSGIGTDVWSLTGATNGADYKSGTSMATPQVAGLAAYLWAMKPWAPPRRSSTSSSVLPTPRPAEVLMPDPSSMPTQRFLPWTAVMPTPGSVGLSLMWRTASGAPGHDWQFNEKDVEASLDRFDAANGDKDYSRYDLNGDGKTGGDTKAKFNLDMDYPPTYSETVHQIIEGRTISPSTRMSLPTWVSSVTTRTQGCTPATRINGRTS